MAWVDRQIADYGPPSLDDAGEVRNRFARTIEACGFTGSSVFGFQIPSELVEAAVPEVRAKLAASLARWKEFLATVDGGPAYFERSLVAAGLAPARAARRDPAISQAVAVLLAHLRNTIAATDNAHAHEWIKYGMRHAFAIAPAVATATLELHPALEALYAELGGLWIGSSEPGGEQAFDDGAEAFLFVPYDWLDDDWATHLDGYTIFDRHPDSFSWTMIDDKTGAISTGNKLHRTPKQIAGSLVEYLGTLAANYGRL